MNNLKKLLTKRLQVINKKIVIAIFVLAIVGFADATYLTIEHFQNKIPPCGTGGCETVLTSAFSSIGPIPLSLVGSIFYLFILVMLILYWDTKKEIFVRVVSMLSILGGIFALVLIGLMLFVIGAICKYCMVSDVITIAIAILGFLILKKNKNEAISQ